MSNTNVSSIQESATSRPNIVQHFVDEETETPVDGELAQTENDNPFMPRKRKKTSKAWADFKEITNKDGINKAVCIHCNIHLSLPQSAPTLHLLSHIQKCFQKKMKGTSQKNLFVNTTLGESESVISIQNFVYSQAVIREALSHLIIMHELPFNFAEYEMFNVLMRKATPHYEKISRTTTRNDCLSTYKLEKKILLEELRNVNRMSVTTDLWTSDQNKSYMIVTGHYVDSDWNLQKRILKFCGVLPPHSGVILCYVLHQCLIEWGIEKKVWTVTVDNAKNNDLAVKLLKENLSYSHYLPLDGKIFHIRCCAQIIPSIVVGAKSMGRKVKSSYKTYMQSVDTIDEVKSVLVQNQWGRGGSRII